MSTYTSQDKQLWAIAIVFLILMIGLWLTTKNIQAKWTNVPTPPDLLSASGAGLGDSHFAYRRYGIILQNMGDMGGRVTSLRDYNYDNLAAWFELLNQLDPRSNFVPFIASYYYGGLDEGTHRLRPLAAYLAKAGNNPEGQKWRWLAQAAYLARFKINDLDLALEYANILSRLDKPDLPAWARQLPANVLNARGEKEAAFGLLNGILLNDGENMNPAEVNATIAYICEQVLTPAEAKDYEPCSTDY